jgi:hypothetical protein
MITRFQARKIKTTFPFLRLPAELRVQVYKEALSLHKIYEFMEEYSIRYQSFSRNQILPKIGKACPVILLVNKQIYKEARNELLDEPLVIFGFFPGDLISAISSNLVQKIPYIHFVAKINEDDVSNFQLIHIFEHLRTLHEVREGYGSNGHLVRVRISCPIITECVKGFLSGKDGFLIEDNVHPFGSKTPLCQEI